MARAAKKRVSLKPTLTKEDLIRAGVPESNLFQDENGRWQLRREWRGRIRFRAPSGAKIVPSTRTRPIEQGPSFSSAHLDDLYVRHWRSARRGNRESAHYLLATFCLAVDNGEGVPRPVLAYLQSAITRYLHGKMTLEKALGTALPPHRKKGSNRTNKDPLRLAALFYLYTRRDRIKPIDAKEKVAEECGTTSRNVERALSSNGDLEQLMTGELEALVLV